MRISGKRFKSLAYLALRPTCLKIVARAIQREAIRGQRAGAIQSILIAQPHNSLGDLILSFPLLEEVHREWPDAAIDVLVGSRMGDLFKHIPFVRKVIVFSPSTLPSPLARYSDTLALAQLFQSLGDGPYDLALDPRWDSDFHAFLARAASIFSGSPTRVSYSGTVDGLDINLDGLMTHLAFGGRFEHESIRKVKLLQRASLTNFDASASLPAQPNGSLRAAASEAICKAEAILRCAGIVQGHRYAVIAPSANDPKRIWPIDHMVQVTRHIADNHGLRTAIIGSANEQAICERLASLASPTAVSLAGKTSIIETCGILSKAALFVGNDSGPAHASGMLGNNTIVISTFPRSAHHIDHPNSPVRFRPCGPRVRVLQPDHPLAPCNPICTAKVQHCITQVTVKSVLDTCDELLSLETLLTVPAAKRGEP
jgi:ADP-heptose:LPS heptosyltransferase